MSAAAQSGWDVVSDAPTPKQNTPQQGSDWDVVSDTPVLPYKTNAPPAYVDPQGHPVIRFLKGVWQNTGHALGDIDRATSDLNTYLTGGKPDLEPQTKQMVGNLVDAQTDQWKKTKEAFSQGNYSEAFGHGLATAIPILGPAAAQAAETMSTQQEPVFDRYGNVVKSGQSPDVAGGLGQGVGLAAPYAASAVVKAIPRAGRAAANLERVGEAVDAQTPAFDPRTGTFPPNTGPIDMNAPGKIAMNAQKLPGAGGGVMQDFLQRLTDPNEGPLTFSEAQEYYKAASQVPTKGLSVSMRQQLANFKDALNKSLTDAAEQAGQGRQYAGALREAQRAATAKQAATTVGKATAKYGAKAAGMGAGAGMGAYLWHKFGQEMFGKADGGPILDRYPSRESVLGSLRGH